MSATDVNRDLMDVLIPPPPGGDIPPPPKPWEKEKKGGRRKTASASTTSDSHATNNIAREPVELPNTPAFDFLVQPASRDSDGMFPLGDISVVAGPSGGGKTTWLFQFILKWKRGEHFLGRETRPKPFAFISYDRSTRAFERTAFRMKIKLQELNVYRPTDNEADRTVDVLLKQLVARPQFADVKVFFIEGLDLQMETDARRTPVSKYLDNLQRVAEACGLHLIATVGAPKMKPKERYQSPRERIKGDSAWGRKAETIVYIEPPENESDDDNYRSLWIIPRNGPQEKHELMWKDGLLVEAPPKDEQEHARSESMQTRVLAWVETNVSPGGVFTLATLTEGLQKPKSSVQSALNKLIETEKKIVRRDHGSYQRLPDNPEKQ